MKRQFTKIIAIAILPLWVSGRLFAQHDHEFSVYGGGGLSTLAYKVTTGEQRLGLGGHFGLGYHFFFTPEWGLGTGAELAFYNARFKTNNLSVNYMTTDMQGANFEFRSMVNNLKERQHAMMLQIPLMLQFQTNKSDSKHQFFAAAGGKAGIPLKGKYRTTANLNNAGYYAYEDALYDTQTFMGFGNFPGKKANGDLDFKTTFFLSAEAGVKWKLNNSWSLYTGIYLDYGLNNIKESQDIATQPFLVAYNWINPPEFGVNSILQSKYYSSSSSSGSTKTFTDKITPIAVGIKLRLAFGIDCNRKATKSTSRVATKTDKTATEKALTDAEEDAARKAEEDAARKAADEAARKAEADRLAQEQEAQRAAAAKAQQEADALNAAKRQIEQPIDNYNLNQIDPGDYQRQKLDEKIVLLQQYPALQFYIYGHTCDLGTFNANERIGLGRATKAKSYMISKGIAESRILNIASKRDTEPVVPNDNEENRKKNRRVVIKVE